MKKKGKKKCANNTHHIKEDYSYYVEQVADLYDVGVATVRRWIREKGLKRIPHIRPHLVHSSELKAYQEKQRVDRKKPCAPNEAFCCRCQRPRTPKMGSGGVTLLPNTSFRFTAECNECGSTVIRNIAAADWGHPHPLAAFLSGVAEEHNGACQTPRECSLQPKGKA